MGLSMSMKIYSQLMFMLLVEVGSMLCSIRKPENDPEFHLERSFTSEGRNSHLCCLYRLLVREGGINITR